jgi:hypothetical protein
VKQAFAGVTGVRKVVGPEDLKDYGIGDGRTDGRSPDMLLLVDDGWIVGDTAAGALSFRDKPERKGSHAHDPRLPNLHRVIHTAGSGIRAGLKHGEIENTAVAPTIAELLGLRVPDADGRPLADALAR